MKKDTIVANATPLIPSAVGIVRISGEDALKIGKQIFTLPQEIQERKAYFGKILDLDGSVLDEGLFIYFKAPKSFTGEDVVEIYPHGSVPVIKKNYRKCYNFRRKVSKPWRVYIPCFFKWKDRPYSSRSYSRPYIGQNRKSIKSSCKIT